MGTVSKEIADDVIAGKYDEDRVVKIVKYTNLEGGDAYGIITEGHDLDTYRETEFVRNPVTYWDKPTPPLVATNVYSALTKKQRNGWTAADHFDLPNNHQLHVTTYKHDDGIRTTALVGRVEDWGTCQGFTYALGVGRPGDGDFYMKLCKSNAKATEKNVAAVHAESLSHLEEVLAKVKNHYGAKLAQKES